ncbi:ABC transporter permease [Cribrihabitans marinus]|nr:ABC transporter permease [Cribrihabitans marinus]GGH39997.1 nickel ABC transporter permease [Cribrihabitans marinus]
MARIAQRARRGARPLPMKARIGLTILAAYILAGIFGPMLLPFDPDKTDILRRLKPPSNVHWLGTDQLGRDFLTRLVVAIRVDLPIAFAAAFFPMVIGTALGAIAGYYGKLADTVVSRAADLVQAFPVYVFLLVLVFALGAGATSFIVAATVIAWVGYARLARGEVMRLKSLEFVEAARVTGLPERVILTTHVLPNALPQTLIYYMSDVVLMVLVLSSLSFLGVGIQPPTAEWGRMIAEGQPFLRSHWWLAAAPGLMLMVFGTGLSLLADGLDDWLRS